MTAKPRLLVILPLYDPAAGSHFFHLYEFLGRAAHDSDLTVIGERCECSAIARNTPHPLRVRCQRFAWPPLRMLELIALLLRARFFGCRNFYVHYSFYGALAAWFAVQLFGGTVFYWNSGEPWKYNRPWLEERVFRFILRRTVLVTNPPGLAAEYQRRYGLDPQAIRIVPHYINVSRFRNSEHNYDRSYIREKLEVPVGGNVVLFVHRLSRRKGAHLIPEIAMEVTKRRKDVIFVVVGSGPEFTSLKFRVKSLKLEPHVRLVGEVPQRDIVPYFRASDILLLPSQEEGFPHVLLEAAAAGLPFVASDVGGIREMLPQELQDSIVKSGDHQAFAAKILELLAQSEVEAMKNADLERQWVMRYDVQTVLPQFVKLFEF